MNELQAPGALPINHYNYRADKNHFTTFTGTAAERLEDGLIIVHSSVGTDSRDWLTRTSPPPLQNVSAHALVREQDRYNLVDPKDIAYACGYCLPGVSNGNTLSLEIENLNDVGAIIQPYSDMTVNLAAHQVACWMYSFGIPIERVKRHMDVAVWGPDYKVVTLRGKLGRKHDPVGLDWEGRFLPAVQTWFDFLHTLSDEDLTRYCI